MTHTDMKLYLLTGTEIAWAVFGDIGFDFWVDGDEIDIESIEGPMPMGEAPFPDWEEIDFPTEIKKKILKACMEMCL